MKKFSAFMFAALLIVVFAVPAGAVTTKVDAVLIYDFGYISADENFQRNHLGRAGDGDWSRTSLNINPFGYFGATFKGENVGLKVNIAPRGFGDDLNGDDTVYLRQFYGYWDVNPSFQLLVGQIASKHSRLGPSDIYGAVTPTWGVLGADDRAGLLTYNLGFGNVFARRIPQIQGNFKFSPNAQLQIALIDPNANGADTETTLPRIDTTVQLDFGPLMVAPSILYLKTEYDYDIPGQNTGWDNTVTSWNFALPVQYSSKGFTFKGELNMGENWGNTNLYPHGNNTVFAIDATAPVTSSAVRDTAGKITDTEMLGYWLELNYKFGNFIPGIIYGYQKFENDSDNLAAGKFVNERSSFTLFCKIPVAKTYIITPYYKQFDLGENEINGVKTGLDLGKVISAGVNFMVVF